LAVTSTLSPTASLGPEDAAAGIIHVVPVPNPHPGPWYKFAFESTGRLDHLKLKIYDKSFVVLLSEDIEGRWNKGWNSLEQEIPDLGNGVYYAVLAGAQRLKGGNHIAKLMVIR
jgi:hypothetical protein